MWSSLTATCALALATAVGHPAPLAANPVNAAAPIAEPAAVRANGVELHYLERGEGIPIVFIHGGLADYREWAPVAEAMPTGFRLVTYSRRHSFPNSNPAPGTDHSMVREVEDLAALIEKLQLGPVHLVGSSYGAFTALLTAIHRPDLVRSVVAAEPPLLHWLPDIADGQAAHDHFYRAVMDPSAAAFASDDPRGALAVALDYFIGPGGIDQIPAEIRDMLLANIDDWRAITTAPESLPQVTREQLGTIAVPVLLISGGATAEVHRLIDPEVARVIPRAERIIIAGGTHEMCSEKPGECAAAIAAFLDEQGR